MSRITVTIEKGKDLYGAWAENIPGIYGSGETIEQTKNDILKAIELFKKYNKVVPEELLGNVEIEWKLEVESHRLVAV